jgi:hypothetical protein
MRLIAMMAMETYCKKEHPPEPNRGFNSKSILGLR